MLANSACVTSQHVFPENAVIMRAEITDHASQAVSFALNVMGGKSVVIDWGDGDSTTWTSHTNYSHIYDDNGVYRIMITGDWQYIGRLAIDSGQADYLALMCNNLHRIHELYQLITTQESATWEITPAKMQQLTKLTDLRVRGSNTSGTFSSFTGHPRLTYLNCWYVGMVGVLSDFVGCTELETISARAVKDLSGNITDLALLPIKYLWIEETGVSMFTDVPLTGWDAVSYVNIAKTQLGETDVVNFLIRINDCGSSNGTLLAYGLGVSRDDLGVS